MNNCALLVIDMQNGFISPASPLFISGAPATVHPCAEVIRFCRDERIPVFFVTREYLPDGSNVEHTRYEAWLKGGKPLSEGCAGEISAAMPKEFGSSEQDFHIIKPRYSAFFSTELDLILRRKGIRHVILTGTTTPNCIRTSCYDAICLDYEVTVLSDCTSSVINDIQQSNLLDMANIGAHILSSKEFMLQKGAAV